MQVIDLNTFNALKESTGGDFVNDLMITFLEDTAAQMETMKAALAANDAETFQRAAHSIKSNSLMFGAEELAALARELETMGRDKNLEVGDRIEVMIEAFELVRERLIELR